MRRLFQLWLVGTVLCSGLVVEANERAAKPVWRSPKDRRAKLVRVADTHRLPQAKPQLVEALKKSMPGLEIDASRVRVVQSRWDERTPDKQFLGFMRELGQVPGLVGVAGTPHSGGVHPQAIFHRDRQPGELGNFAWKSDWAQWGDGFWNPKANDWRGAREGWSRTLPLDDTSGKPTPYLLWSGPPDAVNAMGLAAHARVKATNKDKLNCATEVGKLLKPLGGPFEELQRLGFGRTSFKDIVRAAQRAGGPDLIVVAIPAGSHWVNFQDRALEHVARKGDILDYP